MKLYCRMLGHKWEMVKRPTSVYTGMAMTNDGLAKCSVCGDERNGFVNPNDGSTEGVNVLTLAGRDAMRSRK